MTFSAMKREPAMTVHTSVAETVNRANPLGFEGVPDRQPPVPGVGRRLPDGNPELDRSQLAVLLIEDNAYDIEIIRRMLADASQIQFHQTMNLQLDALGNWDNYLYF